MSKFEVLTSQEPLRWSPGTCGDPQVLSGDRKELLANSTITEFRLM